MGFGETKKGFTDQNEEEEKIGFCLNREDMISISHEGRKSLKSSDDATLARWLNERGLSWGPQFGATELQLG